MNQLRSMNVNGSNVLDSSHQNITHNTQHNNNSGNCVASSLHRLHISYSQAAADHKQLGFPHQLSPSMADIAAAAAAASTNTAGNLLIDDHDMLPGLWPTSQQQSHHPSGKLFAKFPSLTFWPSILCTIT